MIIVDRMGCSTSIYDNPDITNKQSQLQPIIKASSGLIVHTNSYHTGTNGVTNKPTSKLKASNGLIVHTSSYHTGTNGVTNKPTSKLKKVTPIPQKDSAASQSNGHIDSNSTHEGNSKDRLSPALSDRTDTNKSIKRVAFNDEPQLESGPKITLTIHRVSLKESVEITGSPIDMKRARRKRENNLRKRLLNKMGEAESISERMLLESERLSLTSSMSRTTSRTGSPFPVRSHDYNKNDDDNTTEISDCNTPREDISRDSNK